MRFTIIKGPECEQSQYFVQNLSLKENFLTVSNILLEVEYEI